MFESREKQARQLDAEDTLAAFREAFFIPENPSGNPLIYFCGNSLGLQPRSVSAKIAAVLEQWQEQGVEGWFDIERSWLGYEKEVRKKLMPLTGSRFEELSVMNSLTVNLHALFTSFYRPQPQRHKVLMEANAFPSDIYMVKSQAALQGYTDVIIEVGGQPDTALEKGAICDAIERHHEELAMVFIGGVNYFTGQLMDMQAIAETAQRYAVPVGFDLAHAIGNVPLELHEWGADFAAWCSYKYLNSGPGGISGIFVHEKHHGTTHRRMEGWWGNDLKSRFAMAPDFDGARGAEGWQVSTSPVIPLAMHDAALDITARAGMKNIREKGIRLSAFLYTLLTEINRQYECLEILTPERESERGCQLSVRFKTRGREIFDALLSAGVIGDWREPDVIRLSPVPLYNTFGEVYETAKILTQILERHN
ncbi:MAG: kynureninase [Mucilaginibacter polytrichastri]|nr:kynureninase [Mucilaginibacter polytrichastri]